MLKELDKPQIKHLSYRFSTIQNISKNRKLILRDFVSCYDGLLRHIVDDHILAEDNDGIDDYPMPPDHHMCLALSKDSITVSRWNRETKTNIVAWSMVRRIEKSYQYTSFNTVAPIGEYELMVYVTPGFRLNGIALQCCKRILNHYNIDNSKVIRVFSTSVIKILEKIGYKSEIMPFK